MKKKKILIGALLATAVIGVSSCSSDIIPTTQITPTQSQEPEVIKKTISFDSQGGSSVISISVKVGDKATKPNAPEKVGYTFGGWYKESSCVNEWNFETETVLGDTTLYAKWTVVYNPTPNPDPQPTPEKNDGAVQTGDNVSPMLYAGAAMTAAAVLALIQRKRRKG